MNWLNFLLWVLLTLGVVSGISLLAKKWDVKVFYALYATLTIVANIIAVKLIMIGQFIVPAAVLVYSATFLLTDIVDEIWGRRESHRIVLMGFLANVAAVLFIWLSILWQPASFVSEEFTQHYKEILGFMPRIVAASVISYLISQNHDVWAFHFWKEKTKGKYLWLRNNASTIVSQFLDTVIFITLAFYGTVGNNILLQMIIGQYTVKILIALADTPFMYVARKMIENG